MRKHIEMDIKAIIAISIVFIVVFFIIFIPLLYPVIRLDGYKFLTIYSIAYIDDISKKS